MRKRIKEIKLEDNGRVAVLTMDKANHFLTENDARRLREQLGKFLDSRELTGRYGRGP